MTSSDRMAVVLVCVGIVLGIGWWGTARGHDLYGDWKMPDSPATSCCNEHDCRPVTAYQDEDGRWVANVEGLPVKIPPHKVMKGPSPDGRSHWCGNAGATYCFRPGEVRS